MKMKFYLLVLCIGLVEISSGSENNAEDRETIRGLVPGASDQFIDDFVYIMDKNQDNAFDGNNTMVMLIESINFLSEEAPGKRIEVKGVREYHNGNPFFVRPKLWPLWVADEIKPFEAILSKTTPPERYQSMLNLFTALSYINATTEEIESALNYLYGNGTAETTRLFIKLPVLTEADCSRLTNGYYAAVDLVKSMIDIKPKVIEDMDAIRKKSTCSELALVFLGRFATVLKELGGERTKIDACTIAENKENWDYNWKSFLIPRSFDPINFLELRLAATLPDETFRGILNFLKLGLSDVSTDQIQKALEYLYADVPAATKCSYKSM